MLKVGFTLTLETDFVNSGDTTMGFSLPVWLQRGQSQFFFLPLFRGDTHDAIISRIATANVAFAKYLWIKFMIKRLLAQGAISSLQIPEYAAGNNQSA
jgi:hypothetical protein